MQSDGRLPGIFSLGDLEIPPSDIRLSHQVGRGGMGKVYLGDWRGTPVAVKVLWRKRHSEMDLERQFLRETSVLASLRHPCICASVHLCSNPG